MKFSISSRELRSALKAVRKVILKRNALPLLDNALISLHDEKYYITGSSVENTLTMPIDLRAVGKETFKPFCIDVTNIIAILATLPEQPIELLVNPDTFLTTLKYQGGEFNIPAYDGQEYPLPKPITNTQIAFSAPSDILLPAMKAAVCLTGDDELRPVLTAVALDVNLEGITFVSTNSKSLYKYVYTHGAPFLSEGAPAIILIPKNIIAALETSLSKAEVVSLRSDGRQVEVVAGDVSFSIRSVDGKYPNYNSVIPKEMPYHVTLPLRDFISSIRRISRMASDASKMVAIRRNSDGLCLTAEDIDYSRSASEQLPMNDCTLPEDFAIGINASALLLTLGAISTENVRIELSAPNKAVILREDAPNSTLLELLMPMQLNN